MEMDIHLSVLLNKSEQLHHRYLALVKARQTYLYITLFTSVVFLLAGGSFLAGRFSPYLFPGYLALINILPALALLFLWVQLYQSFTVIERRTALMVGKLEERFMRTLTDKAGADDVLRHVLASEFESLDGFILTLGKKLTSVHLALTLTWSLMIIMTLIHFVAGIAH